MLSCANALFVLGRLPRDVSEREIKKLVTEFGPVIEIRTLSGYAFVEFDHERDAKDAVHELDGIKYLGDRIQVEFARTKEGRRPERRERQEHFAPTTRGKYKLINLKDLMRKAGNVLYTDVEKDGMGVVEFNSREEMDEAIRLYDGIGPAERTTVTEIVATIATQTALGAGTVLETGAAPVLGTGAIVSAHAREVWMQGRKKSDRQHQRIDGVERLEC
ncbi:hypothetical protein HK101_005323 [Irineochytrium annulatum]|nr:hypothetical protein HK101_005323 [Irineochytrium annulatum]